MANKNNKMLDRRDNLLRRHKENKEFSSHRLRTLLLNLSIFPGSKPIKNKSCVDTPTTHQSSPTLGQKLTQIKLSIKPKQQVNEFINENKISIRTNHANNLINKF